MATDFRAKNQRRAQCRSVSDAVGDGRYQSGRRARKSWARNGAFGQEKPHLYNLMVAGTTGLPREEPQTRGAKTKETLLDD